MPLRKDEIRLLLGDIENERVERTLSTDSTKQMSEAIFKIIGTLKSENRIKRVGEL